MCTQLSPWRTVNHQTSICITNDGPHVALGVGLIYGNTFICSHVQAITEERRFL